MIGIEVYAPVLKTGDRFKAKYKDHEEIEYEFIGFAPFDETGWQYLICKNVTTGEYIGVEHGWFNEGNCGRKIMLEAI